MVNVNDMLVDWGNLTEVSDTFTPEREWWDIKRVIQTDVGSCIDFQLLLNIKEELSGG